MEILVKLKIDFKGVRKIIVPKTIIPSIQPFNLELSKILLPITGFFIFLQEYAKHNSKSIKHKKAVVPATSGPERCKFKK